MAKKKPKRARAAKPAASAPPAAPPKSTKRKAKGKPPLDLALALREAFATNERQNQFLLEQLEPRLWQAVPPNTKPGTGRTLGAIVTHMHNVRHMWLTISGREVVAAPDKLDRHKATLAEAKAALRESALALDRLLVDALRGGGRVREFKPDVVAFVAYAISHEAHHRGQVCLLARMLGHALPKQAAFGLWDWRHRHAEIEALLPLEPEASADGEAEPA